ncbi:DUF115 domain-containing protein [Candidatus Dependentiae bacterium]|nr:DUF115 domain-containing protein [Candidatus Dependentiae bacterium]
MKIKNENLNFLKTEHNGLYNFLQSYKSNESGFFVNPSHITDVPHISFINPLNHNEKINLNSRINPVREMERILESELKFSENSVPVFAEFLGGYEQEIFFKLRNCSDFEKVIYIIFFPEIISLIIEKFDITFLKKFNTGFIYGKTTGEIQSRIRDFGLDSGKYKFIIPQNLSKLITSVKPEFSVISDFFSRLCIKKNYKDKFGNIIEENINKNKKHIKKNNGISNLKKNPVKSAGILIGAGPSADYYIENIKINRDKVMVIAVDAAIPIMKRTGIKPDFTVSVDPQKDCVKFFEGFDSSETALIFSPYTYHEIVEKYEGDKFHFISKHHPVLDGLKNGLDYDSGSELGGGASVSLYALDFLIGLGYSKIIFTGQDFGFTNDLMYSKYSCYFYSVLKSLNKFITFESRYCENLIKMNAVKFCGIYTLHNLKNYIFEFEKYIELNKNIRFYNMNKHGIKVNGSVNIESIGDVL